MEAVEGPGEGVAPAKGLEEIALARCIVEPKVLAMGLGEESRLEVVIAVLGFGGGATAL